MDAVQFIRERNRMCYTHTDYDEGECGLCPLSGFQYACSYVHFMEGHENEIVSVVEQWSKEHPQKTILQDLLEKYPEVILEDDGTPDFCPMSLGYAAPGCERSSSCEACWNAPLE